MAEATLAAMMDDLGIGRQNDLPLDHNPRDRIPPRRRPQIPRSAQAAGAGWGALAANGLDDAEAEASKALGDLGGGRLHAAAQNSMNALYNNVRDFAHGTRPFTQRPNAGGARMTGLGAVVRDGVPTRRFGTHPNTQTTRLIPQVVAMPQPVQGPPAHAKPAAVLAAPLPAATRPAVAPVVAMPPTARPAVVPSTPHAAVRPLVASVAAPVAATPAAPAPIRALRAGAVWAPPRVESAEPTVPGADTPAAKPTPPPVAEVSDGQTTQQVAEVIEEERPREVPAPIIVPSGGSITILKSTSVCRVTVATHSSTSSITGNFTMKLVQKEEVILGSFLFKFDNGTSAKFDWDKMVAVNLDIPKNVLTIALTFDNGGAGGDVYTISVISAERMKKLKETLHSIHEIHCLNKFMTGREDQLMEAVQKAELKFGKGLDTEFAVGFGESMTLLAANEMAINLGIPAEALTSRVRNIMRASFVRLASQNFENLKKDKSTGTEPATGVASKKEETTNDPPISKDGATPTSVHPEKFASDDAIKETADSIAAITSTDPVPPQEPVSDVVIKQEEVDDVPPHLVDPAIKVKLEEPPNLADPASKVKTEEPPHLVDSATKVKIEKEEITHSIAVAETQPDIAHVENSVTDVASSMERTPAPHEREFTASPIPVKNAAPHESAITVKAPPAAVPRVASPRPIVSVPWTSIADAFTRWQRSVSVHAPTAPQVAASITVPPPVYISAPSGVPTPAVTAAPPVSVQAPTTSKVAVAPTQVPTPEDISVPAVVPTADPANNSIPDAVVDDELEEGELVKLGDGVEACFEHDGARTRVTTMQTLRQGRLVRKIVTVEEYVYDDGDVSSEL